MPLSNEPKLNADFSTHCVVIGSGPAGGALASFLAQNGTFKIRNRIVMCLTAYKGITGIIISKTSHTARTPRAHITNIATMGKF
jgi:glycerol-3-phosphate dehydrogenase